MRKTAGLRARGRGRGGDEVQQQGQAEDHRHLRWTRLRLSPMSRRWLSVFESDLPRLVRRPRDARPPREPERRRGGASRGSPPGSRDRLRERGVPAELRPCPPRGDALLASVAFREGGTLLLGHLDTVWPAGTLAAMPVAARGGTGLRPRRLRHEGRDRRRDGRADRDGARVAAVARSRCCSCRTRRRARAASRELTAERGAPPPPGARARAVARRRGQGRAEGLRHLPRSASGGRAAHAGLEPEKGASALAEMARFVLFLEGVADAARGTTLTATPRPGRQRRERRARRRPSSRVDARAWTREEAERVERGAARLPRRRTRGVSVAIEGGFDRPPLEPTPASEAALRARPARGRGARLRAGRGARGRGLRRQLHRGGRRPHPRRPRPPRRGGARPRRARARRGPAAAGGAPRRPPRGGPSARPSRAAIRSSSGGWVESSTMQALARRRS